MRAESGGSDRVTLDGRCIRSLVGPGLAGLHVIRVACAHGASERRPPGEGEIAISGVAPPARRTSSRLLMAAQTQGDPHGKQDRRVGNFQGRGRGGHRGGNGEGLRLARDDAIGVLVLNEKGEVKAEKAERSVERARDRPGSGPGHAGRPRRRNHRRRRHRRASPQGPGPRQGRP